MKDKYRRTKAYGLPVLILALFLLAACASGTGTPSTGETPGVGAGAPVQVSLSEYQIDMPASITAGATTFEITNAGTREHSFEIEGQGIDVKLGPHLQAGETGTLQVDLQAGTYTVYCPVGDHREQGMELELTVNAP